MDDQIPKFGIKQYPRCKMRRNNGEDLHRGYIIRKKPCTRVDRRCRSGNATGNSFKATLWHTRPFRLVLLHSCSDTVRGGALHKTLISSSLIACGLPQRKPKRAFCSAEANCGLQGIADSPHSTAILFYIKLSEFASYFARNY